MANQMDDMVAKIDEMEMRLSAVEEQQSAPSNKDIKGNEPQEQAFVPSKCKRSLKMAMQILNFFLLLYFVTHRFAQ